ncbi:Rad1/Rec1/Rad17, partial [Vararia minispora EC-137]
VLSLSAHDVRYFMSLLRGISFSNRASVLITSEGMVMSVEEARSVLATAWIFADVFDDYAYTPPTRTAPSQTPSSSLSQSQFDANTEIEITINSLIEALNIFGSASGSGGGRTTRKWKYPGEEGDDGGDGDGERRGTGQARIDGFLGNSKETGMRMIAEEKKGPMARCEITTFDAEPQVDISLDLQNIVLKIIIKSSFLYEALSDLDPSYDKLTFIANPVESSRNGPNGRVIRTASSKAVFSLHAAGAFVSSEMEYPNDKEVLEEFHCNEPVKFSYRFAHLHHMLRALQNSSRTSLRIDSQGILSMQALVPPHKRGARDCYIDFLVRFSLTVHFAI